MAEGDVKRWLKYGCFGCLGCLGLIVIVLGLSLSTAYFKAKSEKSTERVLTRPVPPEPPVPAAPQAPNEPKRAEGPVSKARGTLVLDFQDAEFHIEPGVAGDPIRVEATYDEKSFELEEHSEERPDGKWAYRVQFRRTKSDSFLAHIFEHLFTSIRPGVRVSIPPDTPIALEASMERGGLQIELGGTRVTSVMLDVSMGGMDLKVSKPLAEPLERFTFKSHMGGGEIRSLGNASPRIIEIESAMGGVDLDLRGAWQADSDIKLHGTMGGTSVRLPEGVRLEGVPGRSPAGPQTGELKLPTLRFTSSSEMGEVEFK